MEGFEVTKIGKHIFCILDAGNSSFYMVEGDEKAAVIDTGTHGQTTSSCGNSCTLGSHLPYG